MRLKANLNLNAIIVDGLLIGCAFIFEICYSKAIVTVLPFLTLAYIFRARNYGKSLINYTTFWLLLLLTITTVNGVRLVDFNEEFSVVYNTSVYLCILLVQMLFLYYTSEEILNIIRISVLFASIVTGVFLFVHEYEIFVFRWHDFVTGNAGYRLGVSSNINPNTIAWSFGFFAFMTLYFGIVEKKIFYYFIFALQIIVIFFTGSKSGLLFALLPIFYYAILYLKKANIKRLLLIIAIIVVVWLIIHRLPVLYTLIGRRIDSMIYTIGFRRNAAISKSGLDVGSTEKRLLMIDAAQEMFWRRPVIGWGIGAFAKYSGFGYYSHNNYMEILVSCGFLGFILYYGYIIYLFIHMLMSMSRSKYKDLSIILLLSIFLLDFSTVNFYSNVLFGIRTVLFAQLVLSTRMEVNAQYADAQ